MEQRSQKLILAISALLLGTASGVRAEETPAPDTSGDVALWVVLRDDRGGTAWQRHRVRVVP